MGKKQIHVPDDVVGTKVGCTGMAQDTIKALNGVPVFTVPPEMYQQMQTGVIDSATVAWGVALEWQLQEQVKNVMDFSFGGGQLPVFVTETAWGKISPEDQQIMMNVAAQAEQANREYNQNQKQEAQAKWGSIGIPVYNPTPEEEKLWMDKFSIIWDQYLNTNKSAGISDIDAIFNEWKTASLMPRTK
jgi:TRAP-type C4-dicarboxylate transport system substrate-binding protein